MKIYIGFSKPRKFKIGSELIRWWSGTNYSHVYIRFISNNIPSSVYHAAHGMVHFRSFVKFKEENCVIKEYEIDITDKIKKEMLTHCMLLSGDSYGYVELLKIFLSDCFYSITGKQIGFKDNKGYICSELVGEFLSKKLGIVIKKPLFLLKPSDIDKLLINKYNIL